MAEINQVDILVKADVPAIVDNQQLLVYVPVATNSNYGIVKPDGDDLTVENGILKLKEGGSVQQGQLDKKVDKLTNSSTLIGDDILKLYAQDNEGQEGYVSGSKGSLENTVAIRTIEGTLKSQRAQTDWDLVPLKQVKEIAQANDTPEAITDGTLDANIGQNAITHKSLEKWTYNETGKSEYVNVDRRIPIIAGKGIKFVKNDDLKAISIYTDLEAKLNENIFKNPEKTYLVWKGNTFPNSSAATFKAPAGCTIDWGDGIVETFTTASTVVNTHTYTDDIKYHLISISGLSSLPYSSFFECVDLIEVVLGEGVSQIGNTVFRKCENLKKVVCGHDLQSIGIESFDYGTIIINNEHITPSIDKNNFYNTQKIIVPKSMINAYKSNASWSKYAYKIVYEVDSSDIETKYDKTGGTIGGNVVITGDLTVNGTQHINNTENLNVENAMIYSNAKGATLATNGGIGIKKNATDVYGIVYDPTSDSVKLGIGKSDANGRFTFNANEGQPVAIRDDSSKFTSNNLVKWDSESYKFVDAGKNVENLVDKLPASLRNQAYVRNANGEDSGLAYTYTNEGNSLALRNASGQLQVSTPSQDNDAANKKFVEDEIAVEVETSLMGA